MCHHLENAFSLFVHVYWSHSFGLYVMMEYAYCDHKGKRLNTMVSIKLWNINKPEKNKYRGMEFKFISFLCSEFVWDHFHHHSWQTRAQEVLHQISYMINYMYNARQGKAILFV